MKGIGLLGAAVEMHRQGWCFQRIAGASAGAIVGALIAAYSAAGRDLAQLRGVMRDLDYRRFRDGAPLDKLGLPGKTLELLLQQGIYRGDYVAQWLGGVLEGVGVRTFGDLRIDDDTESALAPRQRYRLVVMASDVSRGQLVRLPWDYHYYGLDADKQSIVDAVRASVSIPFFFRPVDLPTGPRGGGTVTLVDGGLLSNFPVDAFDRADDRAPRWPTFGVKLSARPESRREAHPVEGTASLVLACLRTLLNAHDAYHLDDERVTERTVFVDTMDVSAVDFDIDARTQRMLYENGTRAARRFLDRRV